jgi:hypothetical protein
MTDALTVMNDGTERRVRECPLCGFERFANRSLECRVPAACTARRLENAEAGRDKWPPRPYHVTNPRPHDYRKGKLDN